MYNIGTNISAQTCKYLIYIIRISLVAVAITIISIIE
jgi:hypothetical protein